MTKRNPDRLSLSQAVKRIMKKRKCSKAEAQEMLLKALQSGELTAYVAVPDDYQAMVKDYYGPKQ